jgi:dihydroxyacetone kinase-like protein
MEEAGRMDMTEQARRRLIEAIARAMIDHADELTRLDQAIGDGDHGINMKRGFEAVLADLDRIAAKPLPEALAALGMTLVMKVGGASGPLFGTLFLQLGKALPARPSLSDAVGALDAAITAVRARGKSDIGCKTMLDVLIPTLGAMRQAAEAGDPDLGRRLPAIAQQAADATKPMKAIRGRASFLGERSIGHVDPGAQSSALLVAAICDTLENGV